MFEYIVSIDYKEFTFKRVEDATIFAESAAMAQRERYTVKIEVTYKEK